METHEVNILSVIQQNDMISQRDISDQTGLSLGMVNLLLKKFIKVGLIKTERLNGNRIKYMLTPSGFTTLSKKTLHFITRSYQAVLKIRGHIETLILERFQHDEIVYIFGQQDEIAAILIDVLSAHKYNYEWVKENPKTNNFVYWDDQTLKGIHLLEGVSLKVYD
ncbi:winged helix-turn-helix transcriptional regulator [Fusibacter sp. 3D3]|uniref:winged helix-turn-helix transcriptional regulator n=1 Tax=Fusibacter sp. 3D3 TaxID=1048380 RepID=UPI000853E5A9|nr:winged helix-turn-helix transcriptional regulator [Fusibacter sp. 3D3]GAU77790.1 transcriptional regulator [Fusibacter sp. 3D3]